MIDGLRVTSVNVQKSLANTDGILEWVITSRTPVICIQEPAITQGRIRRHPGYHTIGHDDRETRTAIYIAKTHDFQVPLIPQTHTTTASVNGANITSRSAQRGHT